MNNTDDDSYDSVTRTVKNMKELEAEFIQRSDEYNNLHRNVEQERVFYFRTMKEQDFYTEEYKHWTFCDQSERFATPSHLNINDRMLKMNSLCEEMLDSMSIISECLKARSSDIGRVGNVISSAIKKETLNIFTINKQNDRIFSRCYEKKYNDDPASKLTTDRVLEMIHHVSILRDNPDRTQKMILLSRKDVSTFTFYRVREFMNLKFAEISMQAPHRENPYIYANNINFSKDDLDFIKDIIERDKIRVVKQRMFGKERNQRKICTIDIED